MKKIYNKLVRDNIPEIIKMDNEIPTVRILDDEEYKIELKKKLFEEIREVASIKDDIKELEKEIGDVYEVIDATIKAYNLDYEEIMKLKNERKEKRGGFEKKVFLEKTDSK